MTEKQNHFKFKDGKPIGAVVYASDNMSKKRFMLDDAGELIDLDNHKFVGYGEECCDLLNDLSDENEQLKQYKQAVSDVLLSYSQKNLSAKQLGLLTAIMHELGVLE